MSAPASDGIALTTDPPPDEARDALLLACGHPPKHAAPEGFRGIAALWARDRDMLVGQGVILLLRRRSGLAARLAPADWPHPIGLIELLCVRPEYREAGLEERIVRALMRRFRVAVPGRDALVFVGEARAPVLMSTVEALGPRPLDASLR